MPCSGMYAFSGGPLLARIDATAFAVVHSKSARTCTRNRLDIGCKPLLRTRSDVLHSETPPRVPQLLSDVGVADPGPQDD
jgi:hypothetical protein